MSIKDKIFACNDKVIEPVECPEWDCTLYIRNWTGGERTRLIDLTNKMRDGKASSSDFYTEVLLSSVVDEEGNAIFDRKDIKQLLSKNSNVIDRIVKAANRLNLPDIDEKKD